MGSPGGRKTPQASAGVAGATRTDLTAALPPPFALTPGGRLYFDEPATERRVAGDPTAGSRPPVDPIRALLDLAALDVDDAGLGPVLSFWQDFARRFLAEVCALPDLEAHRDQIKVPVPGPALDHLVSAPPPMRGAEYLSRAVLEGLWAELERLLQSDVGQHSGTVQEYLARYGGGWSVLGRVCFHLAENKADERRPFAFLATYASGMAGGRVQHLPLVRALQAYEGANDKLLALLVPVQKGAEKSELLKGLLERREIFHPLAWTPAEAYGFLREVPVFEAAGIVVRVPDWWKVRRKSRPVVSVEVGRSVRGVDAQAMLDFNVEVSLDGEPLSAAERRQILEASSGLTLLKGRWVEIDRERLGAVLEHWTLAERAHREGLTFAEGMRLLAGVSLDRGEDEDADGRGSGWASVTAGPWLEQALAELRDPEQISGRKLTQDIKAELRPYQLTGVRWLIALDRLGLGACLADDMGLGKTLQVITLLAAKKRAAKAGDVTRSLLVVPASLIANWTAEIERFAPHLTTLIAHPSAMDAAELAAIGPAQLEGVDIVITTYGAVLRVAWMAQANWSTVILDEAQAIKNAETKQARAVKALPARTRIALTGTPVENRLSDLWSIFDFLNPGLLGSAKAFAGLVRQLERRGHDAFGPIRALIRPYMLRRLKTDRAVIADLPEKTEQRVWCGLTRAQATHYEQAVRELAQSLAEKATDAMKRRGQILAFLMRMKQICNHPAQWLGGGSYAPEASGKFSRLRELCDELAARQEKVLVFTQFREMTGPLSALLEASFGRPGLVLHGETPVKARKKLVEAFQEELGPPFFVLSLKAGGSGLNLTAASHVVHFDRWWNPAVEDQATDRAFRIGQKKNVLVHKFVCRGTVEERIDAMIAAKKSLSQEILGGSGGEVILTELDDEEILRMVSLDLGKALEEA